MKKKVKLIQLIMLTALLVAVTLLFSYKIYAQSLQTSVTQSTTTTPEYQSGSGNVMELPKYAKDSLKEKQTGERPYCPYSEKEIEYIAKSSLPFSWVDLKSFTKILAIEILILLFGCWVEWSTSD